MLVKIALSGFGNVGQGLAQLLLEHSAEYQRQYGTHLVLTGVVDRGGGVTDTNGLEPIALLRAKRDGGTVALAPGGGPTLVGAEFLRQSDAGVLVEAAATNFVDAEPGWGYVQESLRRGMDVVFASKGSLALHYGEVMSDARRRGLQILFSATIGAPLPSLELIDRVLIGSEVLAFEGIVNGTSHQILTAMSRGSSYDEGVRQAQQIGIAEADPTLDVDGWDAAAKAAILCNAVFTSNLTIHDVERTGIRGITAAALESAHTAGETIKLIARGSRVDGAVRAVVKPMRRPADDPLGQLTGDAMGIIFDVEPLGRMAATIEGGGHGGGITTAMTVIRDLLNLARHRGWTETQSE